ncbi:MAG: alpha/beta fold hydrolase [Caldilinea sp.]|jgi:branched-chain amino acid transport system permease protein
MSPCHSFFTQTARLRFFCRSTGKDDGIPLLVLHGSYGTSRWWLPFFESLPDSIYAIAPDLRGCGQSEKVADGYAIEEMAADLAALVTAWDWDEFHLMAHSSSGAIAVEYVLQNPHRVATLTLVDTVPVEGVFTPLEGYRVLEQMREDRLLRRDALRLLMPTVPFDNTPAADFFEMLVEDAGQMAPAAFTEIARSLSQWNRFAEAQRITLPALLVWGELDTIVDRNATTRTLIAIPGASNLEILQGVGHSPMIEAPSLLVSRWLDFILADHLPEHSVRNTACQEQQNG